MRDRALSKADSQPYGVTALADSCQGDHRTPDLGPIANYGNNK